MDGMVSTRKIRALEETSASPSGRSSLSGSTSLGLDSSAVSRSPRHHHHHHHRHIPIFAVSASLVERDREQYMATGFDGWILKPIDFDGLRRHLSGIFDGEARTKSVYTPGEWERGGWFTDRFPSCSPSPSSSPPPPLHPTQRPPLRTARSSARSSGQPNQRAAAKSSGTASRAAQHGHGHGQSMPQTMTMPSRSPSLSSSR